MTDSKSIEKPKHFIRQKIEEDISADKNEGKVVTRFPPEPNGYLHVGHAKSICLNFGVAEEYNGKCFMRFDDTNPTKENVDYVNSILGSVKWLGFDWEDRLTYASDYFDQLYEYAVELIKKGKAYVCSLNADEMREYRGTLKEPGKNSPYRDRSVEENLDLFTRMKAGEFEEGEHVLRAKIDMSSPNINMRDPVIYRILKASHHRTGDKWCIYPMYDYTHCISDAIEGITHSLCTLEFEDHRPLYDWVLDELETPCHPQQIEFSRLNLNYTITSKRRLSLLVEEGIVDGWDDPRMPTLVGMQRRGYTKNAIRDFAERVGVTKKENYIEMGLLETCVREDLDKNAPRAMAVLNPLKVVIENYPEDKTELCEAPVHPRDESLGKRNFNFSRVLYIERDDFMEDPPKKFFRLAPEKEVRLRYGYIIKCEKVIKDDDGNIIELRCTYDPDTKSGTGTSTKKVKGVIHWISETDSVEAEVRLYDRLFTKAHPAAGEGDFVKLVNPDSLEKIESARLEPVLASAKPEDHFQFERLGYFFVDPVDSKDGKLVFNRTVTLRDSWAKIEKSEMAKG